MEGRMSLIHYNKFFFGKFELRCKNRFKNATRLTQEFLESVINPEKAHFCLALSKHKLSKTRVVQPGSH